MNLILILLILLLLLPALGVYTVAVSFGLIIKILLVVLIVGLILNIAGGNRNFWF